MKKTFLFLCGFTMILSSLFLINTPTENGNISTNFPNSATIHTPILIDGNDQFTWENGVTSGDGTESNPYIIEGWEIYASSNGIEIQNTDKYVILQNNILKYGSLYGVISGIMLENATNVKILNNIIYENYYGINILSSYNNSIINNDIFNSTGNLYGGGNIGIRILDGYNNSILNNNISFNYAEGIYLERTNTTTITNNIIMENGYSGILLYVNCYNNLIDYNNISSNNYRKYGDVGGICLKGASTNNTIFYNTICNNYIRGIALSGSNNNHILNNTIFSTQSTGMNPQDCIGIKIYRSNLNILINNTVFNTDISMYHNQYLGLQLWQSNNNLIWLNKIFNHSQSQVQVVYDNLDNQWHINQSGNYYGDYYSKYPMATNDGRVWNFPYQISDMNTDMYPLVMNPSVPDVPEFLPISNISITDNITLTWNTVGDSYSLKSYHIYRDLTEITSISGRTPIYTTDTTTFTDVDVVEDVYYYVITASNAIGESNMSKCINVEIPKSPTNFALNYNIIGNTIRLSWSSSEYATQYQVYMNGTLIHETSLLAYDDDIPQNGIYNYYIRSINYHKYNESNVVIVNVDIFPHPFQISSDAQNPDEDGIFQLTWNPSMNADNYTIYQNGMVIASEITVTFYDIANLDDGIYLYTINALNIYGNYSTSTTIYVGIIPSTFILEINSTEALNGTLHLTWSASDHANYYNIYQNETLIVQNQIEPNWSLHNLTNGKYTYYIIAYNDYGNMVSNHVVINITRIPIPFILTISNIVNGSFVLEWTDSLFATHYIIYQNETILANSIETTFYNNKIIINGTYIYQIVAINQYGNYSSNILSVSITIPPIIEELPIEEPLVEEPPSSNPIETISDDPFSEINGFLIKIVIGIGLIGIVIIRKKVKIKC